MSETATSDINTAVSTFTVPARVRPGDKLDINAITYEAVRLNGNRMLLMRDDTSAEVWLESSELVRKFSSGEARITLPAWLPGARHKKWNGDFSSLPDVEKKRAYMRRDYVQAMIRNAVLGYPVKVRAAVDEVYRRRIADPGNAGEWKPSLAVVYNWKEIWEHPDGPKGILRLAFAESERGGQPIDPRVAEFLRQAIIERYFTPERQRASAAHDRFVALCRVASVPEDQIHCLRTTRRAIQALSPYAVARARHGQRAAELLYKAKGKLPDTSLPGEVYEIDAHKFDLIIVDSTYGFVLGRVWITGVIDRCTRMIVGFHIHLEPPCSVTVAAALRNAFATKEYVQRQWPDLTHPWVTWGMPTMVILDNGLENHAIFLHEAADELGFTIHYANTRTPEEKPYIERFFGTVETQFIPTIPGGTGHNPQVRGDYDAEGMACITLEDLDEVFHRYIITVYNRGWHEGAHDIPERLWLEKTAVWGVEPFASIERLDVLLGNYAERVPSVDGIHLLGLRYNDFGENRPLEMIRTRAGAGRIGKLRVRYDRTNLGFIWVQDPVTRCYHVVECLDRKYALNLTLAQHRIIRRHAVERARGYVTVNDLCAARDAMRERVREILGEEHVTGRKAATIFNGLGSKGSWGAMYRFAAAEYESRPIVDLLEIGATEDDMPLFGVAVEREPVATKAAAKRGRAASVASVVVPQRGVGDQRQLDEPAFTTRKVNTVSNIVKNDDLATRSAMFGLTVEGLDE